MTFALGTLAFLAAAWAAIVFLAATFEEHWEQMRSALAGRGAFAPTTANIRSARLRVRFEPRHALRPRVRSRVRAAA